MNRNSDKIAYAGALVALAFALGIMVGRAEEPIVPACAEDVVLVGIGDFADGRWDAYVCGPARDDLVEQEVR